ncbi:Uncharacterised protein [Raoultella terrigena]|uniref:Uncharacterized protein n=2 Tax=Raoultella terrigena TaxID=577 RepID=A0A4U9D5K8_RAOTE|nr:Uncharacterised protein [Raoultella terrigena]
MNLFGWNSVLWGSLVPVMVALAALLFGARARRQR